MSSGISSKPEQAGHGSPFLSFSTVYNNYFIPEKLDDLMDTSVEEQEKYSVLTGDIFLTRTSEVVDELAMSSVALKDYPCATFSGFLKRLRPLQYDITYHKFMAFYLRSKLFRKTMTNNAVLTLRASLNENIFSYLDLILPDYKQQVKIGDLLHLLLRKIELNNRINAELEAMAKTLYDYWFVQFDFPDKNGKPYKSSGGKMVWNKELKQEIPKEWKAVKMADCIKSDKSGDWGKETIEGNYTEMVSCIRGTDINGLNGMGNFDPPVRFILEKNKHKILNPHDLVIEISGGSPTQSTGRIAYITEETLNRFDTPLICSNFCKAISLKNQNMLYNFVFCWNRIYDNGILFGFEGKTSGIKNLLFDIFVNSCWTVLPDEGIVDYFYEIMFTLQSRKQAALAENQQLSSLRDWLLPMLMNGQVKVR